MKKGTIIALVAAGALILAGILLLVLGLSFAGNRPQESKLVRQEVTIRESFDAIEINTADCNVKFAMFSGRDDCMVEIKEYDRVKHGVTVEDGILKIRMDDERNWTDHIGVFNLWGQTESMEMTVYLPAAEYASLQVRTDTGDITILEEPSFKEMMLRSSTGEISCVGADADVLDCMTSTGNISIHNSVPDWVKLQTSTGDIQMNVVAGEEIHVQTSTGETDAENVEVQMFSCSSSTGDVELEGVVAEEYLQIRTTTGDVGIESCDAGRVDIETDTGDVEGRFLTPKWFSARSDTGNVKVPNTMEGGECRIETDTGDIHFE